MKTSCYFFLPLLLVFTECTNTSSPSNSNNNTTNTGSQWDPHFTTSNVPTQVETVAVVGSTLYASFAPDITIGGSTNYRLARWTGSGWVQLGPGIQDVQPADVLATDGANLYVAGGFELNGEDGHFIGVGKWDGSAWTDISGDPHDPYHYCPGALILAASGGKIYSALGNHLFVSSGDGVWTIVPFPNPNAEPTGLASSMGNAFVALETTTDTTVWEYNGSWTQLGGFFHTDPAKDFGQTAVNINSLAVSGGTIYAAGNFNQIGSTNLTTFGVAKWDGTQWVSLGNANAQGIYSTGNAVACDPAGNLYLAQPNHVVKWDGTEWSILGSVAGGFGASNIWDVAAANGMVAICGGFTSVDNVPSDGIGLWH